MVVIDTVCMGINHFITCFPKECVILDRRKIPIPYEYKDWELEKAIYVPSEDKIYLQLRYSNITRVVNI